MTRNPGQEDGPMPRKGVTGHDEWGITEALATALVALEQLPEKHQPRTHMDEIRKLLAAGSAPEAVNLHLAQAKCRLFPELDPLTIYRDYALGDEMGWEDPRPGAGKIARTRKAAATYFVYMMLPR